MSWIRRFRPATPGTVRLVCFPHAGGSASFFHPLSTVLAPGVEVLGVQYPGRQDRRHEPGLTSMGDLADRAAEELIAYTDSPLAFFGHSLGAVLAYEVALRLEESTGQPLDRLFASGRRAPSRYREDRVHLRDDAGILAEVRLLSGTDASLMGDPELVRMILPAIRGDYTAIETYRHTPGRLLSCPVTALTGDADPRTTVDEARAWSEHTTGDFDLSIFPGGHFFISARAADVTRVVAAHLTAAHR
jgi:pyochelin biosynthetic protein PchC